MLVKKIDFSKFSSIKIGGVFEVEVLSRDFGEFNGAIIGGANNILISQNPPRLGILSREFDYIKFDGEILEIGGLTKSAKI